MCKELGAHLWLGASGEQAGVLAYRFLAYNVHVYDCPLGATSHLLVQRNIANSNTPAANIKRALPDSSMCQGPPQGRPTATQETAGKLVEVPRQCFRSR